MYHIKLTESTQKAMVPSTPQEVMVWGERLLLEAPHLLQAYKMLYKMHRRMLPQEVGASACLVIL